MSTRLITRVGPPWNPEYSTGFANSHSKTAGVRDSARLLRIRIPDVASPGVRALHGAVDCELSSSCARRASGPLKLDECLHATSTGHVRPDAPDMRARPGCRRDDADAHAARSAAQHRRGDL